MPIKIGPTMIPSSSDSSISTQSSSSTNTNSFEMRIIGIKTDTPQRNITKPGFLYSPLDEWDQKPNDTITIEININSLPQSLQEFCHHVKLDETIVIEQLLLDAYTQILKTLDEDDGVEKTKKQLFKSILENQYISGNISSDSLEVAKSYCYLQDSDIENIKHLRESYKVLLD